MDGFEVLIIQYSVKIGILNFTLIVKGNFLLGRFLIFF